MADVAVSLNVSGTGIHMKVLDYISAGLPLVVTPKSLEGLLPEALRGYLLRLVRLSGDHVGRAVT